MPKLIFVFSLERKLDNLKTVNFLYLVKLDNTVQLDQQQQQHETIVLPHILVDNKTSKLIKIYKSWQKHTNFSFLLYLVYTPSFKMNLPEAGFTRRHRHWDWHLCMFFSSSSSEKIATLFSWTLSVTEPIHNIVHRSYTKRLWNTKVEE